MSAVIGVGSTSSPISTRKAQAYHPHFSSPDADIILRSIEGTLFRVHSYALRTASGLFQTIFSLPQPKTSPPLPDKRDKSTYNNPSSYTSLTIPIYEPTHLLSYILPLITGKAPPQPLHSLSLPTLTRLLFLAEKWDAPGPISQIRNVINGSRSRDGVQLFSPNSPFCPFSPFSSFTSTSLPIPFSPSLSSPRAEIGSLTGFFCTDPLRVYVLSRHFRWREEGERAAASLLALRMDELERQWEEMREGKPERPEEEEKDVIMFMPTNRDWELLVDLRRRRCEAFKEVINSRDKFTAGNNPDYSCVRCGYTNLDNSPWYVLKLTMMAELEARPSGDTLLAALVVPPPEICNETADAMDNATFLRCGRADDELWPELVSCFRAKCPNANCRTANYDSLATLKQIRFCVEALPWKISWEDEATP